MRYPSVPQPIPYQGSKRQIAPSILRYFPQIESRLVEPFAGSAALSLAVAARFPRVRFWLNDAHHELMALWREIICNPNSLIAAYAQLWHEQLGREREYFREVRNRFNQHGKPHDFLYLLARCVKAAVRYNSNGEFNNTPDNRRRGAKPNEMRRRILMASALLASRTEVTARDYKRVLADCRSDDIVYMDPPYQGVGNGRDNRYLPKVDHCELCDELDKLNARKIMFAVSYDGSTGLRNYGKRLPESLDLARVEIRAGRSTQATLLGRTEVTYESLYLSSALCERANSCSHTGSLEAAFAIGQ